MPRAVVIHLTYLKENEQIWIRHFTSTTNDSQANVQGKFAEAAKKAVDFCKSELPSNVSKKSSSSSNSKEFSLVLLHISHCCSCPEELIYSISSDSLSLKLT
jgi:hypothetical protein